MCVHWCSLGFRVTITHCVLSGQCVAEWAFRRGGTCLALFLFFLCLFPSTEQVKQTQAKAFCFGPEWISGALFLIPVIIGNRHELPDIHVRFNKCFFFFSWPAVVIRGQETVPFERLLFHHQHKNTPAEKLICHPESWATALFTLRLRAANM